jgi:hypothetical protein
MIEKLLLNAFLSGDNAKNIACVNGSLDGAYQYNSHWFKQQISQV